jgi:hypothetical protein
MTKLRRVHAVGAITVGNNIIADEGDLKREFTRLRRERALFHLALEGDSLVLGTDLGSYGVIAAYEDNGYNIEPLRVRVISITNMLERKTIPFDGGSPSELIDLLVRTYDERA